MQPRTFQRPVIVPARQWPVKHAVVKAWLHALCLTIRRREKLLHQAFFMGLECVELLALRGDEFVDRRKAVGDFLLLGLIGWKWNFPSLFFCVLRLAN
jgi:hypothetical protein